MGGFDSSVILANFGYLLQGMSVTLKISFFALILALAVGILVALMRVWRYAPVQAAARLYVDFIRGTPALVQIFFVYYGLPLVGLNLNAPVAGTIALALNSGAFISEMIRGAILGVDPGQMEAGRALGMSYGRTMLRIILPQTVRPVIPPLTGEFITVIKGSSLLSVISIGELTRAGQQVIGSTFRPFEIYAVVALLYLGVNATLTQMTRQVEIWAARRI
jgi:His/Glu/Gln/Arg/opine family amino acid ABC transporter permease subunit